MVSAGLRPLWLICHFHSRPSWHSWWGLLSLPSSDLHFTDDKITDHSFPTLPFQSKRRHPDGSFPFPWLIISRGKWVDWPTQVFCLFSKKNKKRKYISKTVSLSDQQDFQSFLEPGSAPDCLEPFSGSRLPGTAVIDHEEQSFLCSKGLVVCWSQLGSVYLKLNIRPIRPAAFMARVPPSQF